MNENAHQSPAGSPCDHGHAAAHPAFLAHHFDTPQQQFDAGKLGMWIFLVTEVLFFSGLFVAYAVYRTKHPEVFVYAHQFLDKTLGAINTGVLIFSSLTVAWGVRCAQLGKNRGLAICLAITLSCAAFFLGVKAVEYSLKWDEGLLVGKYFRPVLDHASSGGVPWALIALCSPMCLILAGCLVLALAAYVKQHRDAAWAGTALTIAALTFFLGVATGKLAPRIQAAITGRSPDPHSEAAQAPAGDQDAAESARPSPQEPAPAAAESDAPKLAGIFFSIYFIMTGIHALHVIAGMGVISWILWRALKQEFHAQYFGPVDYVGLYWHLVDLVWIYLFPLLYLIH